MPFSVFSFWSVEWWISAAWFSLAFILTSYLPGRVILSWLQLDKQMSKLEVMLVSCAIGVVTWTTQGWVFGWVGLRQLSYLWIILMCGIAAKKWAIFTWQYFSKLQLPTLKKSQHLPLQQWLLIAVLLVGTCIQVLQVASSGMRYADGISFFRVNADDGMLHLSFIGSMIQSFPPQQPGAIGLPISNYHYWSDLYQAELVRVFGLPITHTFFQFVPIVLSLGSGLAVIAILKRWSDNPLAPLFGLIWIYFATELTYIFALLLQHQWGFEMSAIDNGATQLLNIPHSFAKDLFLIGLLPLTEWLRTKKWQWGVVGVLLHAPLIAFKVYFGLFAGVIWAATGVWSLIQLLWQHRRKLRSALPELAIWATLGIAFICVVAVLYIPVNKNAGSLFWSPLEWPKLFLGQANLDWREWWLRKQVYEAAQSWKGIVVFDAIAIAICLASVYGTRMLGWWPFWKNQSSFPTSLRWSLYGGSTVFTFLGLYTLQESGLFNVFNFMAVAAVPLALFAALNSAAWWQRGYLGKAVVVLLILLNIPRMAHHSSQALLDIIEYRPRITISAAEEELLLVARATNDTLILQSHPQNLYDQNTPYTAFFTTHQTYLTGTGMLRSHNQPISDRQKVLKDLFSSSDSITFVNALRSHDISLLYLRTIPSEKLPFDLKAAADIQLLKENAAGQIWQLTP